MRVIMRANAAQLNINKKVVNNLPRLLSGCTSVNPVVVTAMVVIYKASTKENFSITMYPMIPKKMMRCRKIKG